jgi:hypothetical protein
MNEFSVRKLSEVVYGDEEVVSKYRMLRPHSGTDRPFNLFAGAHKSHTECSAVRYGGGGTELPNAAPFHYKGLHFATPPSTNSSIPVIRRMRETTALAISSVCRTCRAEQYWKSVPFVVRRLLRKAVGHSTQVCRWSLGSPRSRESDGLLNR